MQKFLDALHDRLLLFDGAMDAEIQKIELPASKCPGSRADFNDGLSLACPKEIAAIHRRGLEAGADCIETNTFGSNRLNLDECDAGDGTCGLNKMAAEMAVEAASAYDGRYVMGTMGPAGYLPSNMEESLGGIPPDDTEEAFRIQVGGPAGAGKPRGPCRIWGTPTGVSSKNPPMRASAVPRGAKRSRLARSNFM